MIEQLTTVTRTRPDVSRWTPYAPVVTFLQMLVHLGVGTNAPLGHGHKFGTAQADAWTLVAPPQSWTSEDTARLTSLLERRTALLR